MRAWRDKCSPQEATVPTRAKLLYLAHEIPSAGNLGVTKTKDRLLRHFYWPSISRDTRNFSCECDICQRLRKVNSWLSVFGAMQMAQKRK